MPRQPSNTTRTMLAGILLSGTFLAGTAPALAQTIVDVIEVGPDHEVRDIQTAVNRARPGMTIRVHPGTYREGVNITKDGIRIESVVPGGAHVVGGSKPAFSAFGQDKIAVSGFRMSSDTDGVKIGGSPARDAQNIEFSGNTMEGAGGDGFKFFQAKGLKLTGNTIKKAGLNRNGNGDGGIDLVGVDDSTIRGNAVQSTYGHACLMMKGGSDGNTITGNRLLGCERDGITVGGFTGNKFMDRSDGGVEAHNNTITGNEVAAGSDKCPFYFHEAANNRIENNRTVGGRADCSAANGSNNANAQVDTAKAGSGDSSGDLYEGSSESESLDAEFRSAMSDVGSLSCGKGGVLDVVSVAAGAVTSLFGGGKATYAGQMMQQGQHILTNVCLSEQAAAQAKMIATGKYDTRADVRRGMRRVNDLLFKIPDEDWAGSYPRQYPTMDQQAKTEWDRADVQRQYDAGHLSKQAAGEAIQGLAALPGRSDGVIGAAQGAPGALAVGQVGVQASMMGVEVQSMALSTQIAHNQVVEAHLDRQTAAERRAVEYRKRMRRGLPGYEGDGGLGLLLAGEE